MARTKATARNPTEGKRATKAPVAKPAAEKVQVATEATGEKRKTRPGTKALREIRKYQKSTGDLLQRGPFKRMLKGMVKEASKGEPYQMQEGARNALQQAAESFITQLFGDANLFAIHAKRVTVTPKDIEMAQKVSKNVANFV